MEESPRTSSILQKEAFTILENPKALWTGIALSFCMLPVAFVWWWFQNVWPDSFLAMMVMIAILLALSIATAILTASSKPSSYDASTREMVGQNMLRRKKVFHDLSHAGAVLMYRFSSENSKCSVFLTLDANGGGQSLTNLLQNQDPKALRDLAGVLDAGSNEALLVAAPNLKIHRAEALAAKMSAQLGVPLVQAVGSSFTN